MARSVTKDSQADARWACDVAGLNMRHSSPCVTPIEALVRGLRARISCIQASAFTTHFEEMVLYGTPVNHDEQQTPGHSTRLASEPMLGGHVSLVGIVVYEPWQQSFAWQRTGRIMRSITKQFIRHTRALMCIYTKKSHSTTRF